MSEPADIIASVTDPEGRRIDLTAERWAHIIEPDHHPELATLQPEVLRAVVAPDRRHEFDDAEHWFYLAGVGPSRWLKVVVLFREGRGFIATAFPRRRFP